MPRRSARHARYPYLNVLPTNFTTPIYYTPEELELLRGSVTYDYAVNREQAIRRKYREHRDAILDGFPDGAHPLAPRAVKWRRAHGDAASNRRNHRCTVFKDPSVFTYENFKWALSVQWSRLLRTKVRCASLLAGGLPRRQYAQACPDWRCLIGQGRRRLARRRHPRAARRLYQHGHAQGDQPRVPHRVSVAVRRLRHRHRHPRRHRGAPPLLDRNATRAAGSWGAPPSVGHALLGCTSCFARTWMRPVQTTRACCSTLGLPLKWYGGFCCRALPSASEGGG